MGLVEKFNADRIINYQEENIVDCNQLFDAIISVNGYCKMKVFKSLLHPNGRYLAVGNVKQALITTLYSVLSKKFKFYTSTLGQEKSYMDELNKLVKTEKVIPFIDKTYSINDVDLAIKYVIEEHTQGKVAIKMNFKEE